MASSQSANQTVLNAVCWPTYGIIDDLANGRYDEAAADVLCPIGVSGIYEGAKCAQAGDIVTGAADILLPNLIPAGSWKGLGDATGLDNVITESANTAYCQATGDLSDPANAASNQVIENAKQELTDEGSTIREEANKPQEARDTRRIAAAEDDVSRRAAYRAARNVGANRAASAAMAGAQTDPNNQVNAQSAVRNAASSTQNDWLAKQGYATGLEREAENKRKGAFINTIGSIFGGAGSGASTGASLGGGK